MTLVLAYARERLMTAPVLAAVSLVVVAVLAGDGRPGGGWPGRAAVALDILLAGALVVTFRLYDDLMDREHDRQAHPNRILVRASSLAPLRVIAIVLGALTLLGLDRARSGWSALFLVAYSAVLAASYGLRHARTPMTDRILLLKYGVFTLVLIGIPQGFTVRGLVAAGAAFATACVYEWWHDEESPVFSFGGSR